ALSHGRGALRLDGEVAGQAQARRALRAARRSDSPGAAMSFEPTGTIYGTLLNFRGEWQAWAARMSEAPYRAPPKAPVLYIKPANTWSLDGADIPVPARVSAVEVGATIAMVMGVAN